MRVIVCTNYPDQQEKAAEQAVAQEQRAQAHPDIISRVRQRLFGLSAGDVAHQQRLQALQARVQQWEVGEAGEDMLPKALAPFCDDRYLLLRGYPSPSRHGDIDGVLVGPHGVTVYEVKAWHGTFRASDAGWHVWLRDEQAWVPAHGNPTKQALDNASSLRHLLSEVELGSTPLYPLVAIASDHITIESTGPLSVPWINIATDKLSLPALLGRPTHAPELSEKQAKRVADTLLMAFESE